MTNWLSQRRKALWALLGFAVTEATVVNQLHPNAHLTLVLSVLALLGVGAVHQAFNTPKA